MLRCYYHNCICIFTDILNSTVPWCLLQINDTSIYSHFSLLLELLAFLDQTRGESKCDS